MFLFSSKTSSSHRLSVLQHSSSSSSSKNVPHFSFPDHSSPPPADGAHLFFSDSDSHLSKSRWHTSGKHSPPQFSPNISYHSSSSTPLHFLSLSAIKKSLSSAFLLGYFSILLTTHSRSSSHPGSSCSGSVAYFFSSVFLFFLHASRLGSILKLK